MTRNELDTTYNDLNLQTTSKRRLETTNNKKILRLLYNMVQSVLFSIMFSTEHLIAIIWALLHGEPWRKLKVKHLYIIMYINIYKLIIVRQKSPYDFTYLDIDKPFTALKMIPWSISFRHLKKQLNADYTLPVKLNWKILRLIEIKICS